MQLFQKDVYIDRLMRATVVRSEQNKANQSMHNGPFWRPYTRWFLSNISLCRCRFVTRARNHGMVALIAFLHFYKGFEMMKGKLQLIYTYIYTRMYIYSFLL